MATTAMQSGIVTSAVSHTATFSVSSILPLVTVACQTIASTTHVENMNAMSATALMQMLQTAHLTFAKHLFDKQYGALEFLLSCGAMQHACPDYKKLELSAEAAVALTIFHDTIVAHFKRILGSELAYSFASLDSVNKLAGLHIFARPDPSVSDIYAKLRDRYCRTNDATIAQLDIECQLPLNLTSTDALIASIMKREHAYTLRNVVCVANFDPKEQVRLTMAEMRKTPLLAHAYTSILSSHPTTPPVSLSKLADAFEKAVLSDERTAELMSAALKDGRGNVALRTATTTAVSNGAPISSRAQSPIRASSPHRAPLTVDKDREAVKLRIKLELLELAKTAKGKYCELCIVDGHTFEECRKALRRLTTASPTAAPKDARTDTPPKKATTDRRGRRK